ncbi:hydantoinase/oxoprolinase family protein [Roseiconus lacunae]|uniref:Hydantoinase/oxoprolinase family protein n=1 Tax=Roseiconus lacunae TaxID=2605694 RepID=A0ABT7PI71_9BACT|nr:hydantoinase/oxoprolinase family protein [Roseiconus lacunae]MDM4016202.1 hydantoinase/oxoprolinase family protein [Roseiconus lacunae]
MVTSSIGIDIGGANLKYASRNGITRSVDFPLWLRSDQLAGQLIDDLAQLPTPGRLLITMTGELADCFLDRAQGVEEIIQQANQAASFLGVPLTIYGVGNRWFTADEARGNVECIAAANWHALASFIGGSCVETSDSTAGELVKEHRHALLVDIGSTTTDLIPIFAGQVATQARTDFDRLREGSLVYVGGERTPVCTLVDRLEWNGQSVPVMREVFSTIDDVRLLLGYSNESDSCETADGKPRDLFHAANRLARMIGLGHREVSVENARQLAGQVHLAAKRLIEEGFTTLTQQWTWLDRTTVIVSGHVNDLLPGIATNQPRLLSEELGEALSRAAPAYALTRLWESRACDA